MTDLEFKEIMDMPKILKDCTGIKIPNNGQNLEREISSQTTNDTFILNVSRGNIKISKVKYQTREQRTNTILLRIDTDGPRHINPDGNFIEYPHIHIYREGFGDKWASMLDPNIFKDPSNLSQLLKDFLIYFNLCDLPAIMDDIKMI